MRCEIKRRSKGANRIHCERHSHIQTQNDDQRVKCAWRTFWEREIHVDWYDSSQYDNGDNKG